jgi:ABC-type transporter Mla subunit MlaD
VVAFPDKPDSKAVPHIVSLNNKLSHSLQKELHSASKIGTTQNMIPKVQNFIKAYFEQPGQVIRGNAFSILNASNATPPSAASISYWTDQSKEGASQIEKTKLAVEKIDKHLNEIKDIKKSLKGKDQLKSLSPIIKEEKRIIQNAIKKSDKIIKKLEKKEKTIKRLINNPNVNDPVVKNSLSKTLNQVQGYKNNLNDLSSGLRNQYKHSDKNNKISHTAHVSSVAASSLTVPSVHSTHSANKHKKHDH